jgi:hypothetical protein
VPVTCLNRNVAGERYHIAGSDRRHCELSCRLRCCWDRTSLDGTNCPTAAGVSLAGHGPRLMLEATCSAADLGLPMVGATLLHRKGYFFQRLNDEGRQAEDSVAWPIDDFLQLTGTICQVGIEGRQVTVRAWRYTITGISGAEVPVLRLDTDVAGNDPFDYAFALLRLKWRGCRARCEACGPHPARWSPDHRYTSRPTARTHPLPMDVEEGDVRHRGWGDLSHGRIFCPARPGWRPESAPLWRGPHRRRRDSGPSGEPFGRTPGAIMPRHTPHLGLRRHRAGEVQDA